MAAPQVRRRTAAQSPRPCLAAPSIRLADVVAGLPPSRRSGVRDSQARGDGSVPGETEIVSFLNSGGYSL